MGLLKHLKHPQRQRTGIRPRRIIFEKENVESTHISWENKMKPQIQLDGGITPKEYQALASRREEMLSLA